LFLGLAAGKAAEKKRIWALIFWISLVFSAYSVVLAFISSYYIGSYCIMCIVSYGVNLSILFYSWMTRRRFSKSGLIADTRADLLFLWKKKVTIMLPFSTFLAGVLLIWIFFPPYWHFQPPLSAEHVSTGITAEGHPWIGAQEPVLEITEFTDYQCFQCKKMHYVLRRIISQHAARIRIVHRNYPMDNKYNPIVKQPFHIGSGKMALLALFAESKDKFWEMNDYLYSIAGQQKSIEIKELAEKLDLNASELARSLNDPGYRYKLQGDVQEGLKLGITGTPAYVIDGKVYLGQIPADVLKNGLR
jgi:predicted DsbA family dithiol-disulfide isomerase